MVQRNAGKTIENTADRIIVCKYCDSVIVVKFGTYKGAQRYFCKSCRRKFKADNNAFHMKVPAKYINSVLNKYYEGLPFQHLREHIRQKYSYYPSRSIIYQWIWKYTNLAIEHFKDCCPVVGDTWIIDIISLELDGRHKVRVYDIIDKKSRFLLSTHVVTSPEGYNPKMLIKEAIERAGRTPKKVIIDKNNPYQNSIIADSFGRDTVLARIEPLAGDYADELLERFKGFGDDIRVIRSFKSVKSLIRFINGWFVYYNFFRLHQSLGGKTPAEESHIDYDVRNWAELAYVSALLTTRTITGSSSTPIPRPGHFPTAENSSSSSPDSKS